MDAAMRAATNVFPLVCGTIIGCTSTRTHIHDRPITLGVHWFTNPIAKANTTS